MKLQYEQWWDHISINFDQFNPIILGNTRQNPAMIFSHDAHRLPGEHVYWVVDFSQPGDYEFVLYLKPPETGAMISGSGLTGAFIQVGSVKQEKAIKQQADGIHFRMQVPEGETRIQAWFERTGKMVNPYSIQVKIDNTNQL